MIGACEQLTERGGLLPFALRGVAGLGRIVDDAQQRAVGRRRQSAMTGDGIGLADRGWRRRRAP